MAIMAGPNGQMANDSVNYTHPRVHRTVVPSLDLVHVRSLVLGGPMLELQGMVAWWHANPK